MRRAKKVLSYQITLVPESEGGYTVLVPVLPGCISYGRTVEEAAEKAKEAIELHLECLAAHHEPIPEGNETLPILTTMVHVSTTHV